MTSTFSRILSELSDPTAIVEDMRHDHSPFQLASLADCGSPDSIESPGAQFLARVARDVAEHAESAEPDDRSANLADLADDGAHQIADGAVPVYTHERWQVFADLQAYEEDVSELGDVDGDDLTRSVAGVALYMIAERLVHALAEELSEALDEDEEL